MQMTNGKSPVTFEWIGQAGVIVRTPSAVIAVDPFCGTAKDNSERIYPNDIPKRGVLADAVLSTHAHWDHFDPETYRDYVIPETIVGPTSCIRALEKEELDIPGVRLDIGETTQIKDVKIKAVTASHSDPFSVGFLLEVCGKKVYFCGDTLFTGEIIVRNAGMEPDLSFVCINGKLGNMNHYEAASYCKIIGSKAAVPVHYDLIRHNTENPKEFIDSMKKIAPSIKVTVMERRKEYGMEQLLP